MVKVKFTKQFKNKSPKVERKVEPRPLQVLSPIKKDRPNNEELTFQFHLSHLY